MEQDALKNINNFLNNNIYSYLETSGGQSSNYEESVVDKFKSNLLLVIFWLNITDYNS